MDNPYKCNNCTFNPTQYGELGTSSGYCLKHSTLLFHPTSTTCRFHVRKDLPSFVCEDGQKEHASFFSDTRGVVFYDTKDNEPTVEYSEKYAWENRNFDPNLNLVALYHRTPKKWVFLTSFLGAENTVKSLMHSSLSRRYIQQCGAGQDNYRVALSVAYELGKSSPPKKKDFMVTRAVATQFEVSDDTIHLYQKDIELLKLYCVQEYGYLVNDDEIMWVSDDVDISLDQPSLKFMEVMRSLSNLLVDRIIGGAKKRNVYFKL